MLSAMGEPLSGNGFDTIATWFVFSQQVAAWSGEDFARHDETFVDEDVRGRTGELLKDAMGLEDHARSARILIMPVSCII